MWRMAVFPKVDTLPGSQRTASIHNREIQIRLCEYAAHVRWHVIRPFGPVREHWIAVRDLS